MNIEEIKKLRKEVLDIRKQEEEQRNKDNELRNKYLWDIETQLRIIERAKLKKEEGKELSPQEKEYFYKDYLELPYMIEDKFFNDVEKATGMFILNTLRYSFNSKDITYENTLLFFEKDKFDKYKNDIKEGNEVASEIKEGSTKYSKKVVDSLEDNNKNINNNKNNNSKTIKYSNNNSRESLKVDEEKDTRDFERLLKALLE